MRYLGCQRARLEIIRHNFSLAPSQRDAFGLREFPGCPDFRAEMGAQASEPVEPDPGHAGEGRVSVTR